MGSKRSFAAWPIRGLLAGVLVPMAHLARKACAAASAHKAVPAKVRDLERRHLPGDLPVLGGEENDGPGELKSCPCCDAEKKSVVRGDSAEGCR